MDGAGCAQQVAVFVRGLRGLPLWLVTHEAPDGDAIGSLLAMAHLVRAVGARPVALCPDPVPRLYASLPGAGDILTAPPPGERPTACIYLDCAARERIGPLQQAPGFSCATGPAPACPAAHTDSACREVNIDHHPSNTRFGTLNWVDGAMSSAGEMVAHLYDLLGIGFEGAADALYTAIVTDTGSFGYESTGPGTHRLAARLIETGAAPGELHSRIYESREAAAQILLGRALTSMRLSAGGRIVHMVLAPEDFRASGAGGEHTDGIVNHARAVRGAQIGILFYALTPDQVRVAIRTRRGIDADALAARFGGGGHPRAAGCRLAGPLGEAVETFLAAAGEALA